MNEMLMQSVFPDRTAPSHITALYCELLLRGCHQLSRRSCLGENAVIWSRLPIFFTSPYDSSTLLAMAS